MKSSEINGSLPRRPRYYFIIFPLLVLLIGVAAYRYYGTEKKNFITEKGQELSAIADLKVKQIDEWRQERMSDARYLFSSDKMVEQIQTLIARSSSLASRQDTPHWMSSMYNNGHYEHMVIVDAHHHVLSSLPSDSFYVSTNLASMLDSVANVRQLYFSDFHFGENSQIELDLIVPIISYEHHPGTMIGAIVLEIDPANFLYPFIQSWPTPSKTSETVLMERDGNDVLYLNNLRQKQNTALNLRFPLSQPNLPAVRAVQGYEGTLEGTDYRGVEVFAAARHIPNSPWYLIAKVDQDELFAPLHEELIMVIIMGFLLVAFAVMLLGFILRQQRASYYHALYEKEAEKLAVARHYEYLTKYANDSIFLFDDQNRIIEANERACELYGYTREEFLHRSAIDLRSSEEAGNGDIQKMLIEQQNGLVYETIHRRKNAASFPVEASARVITIQDKKFIQMTVRDITERKRTEESVRKLNRIYAVLSEINQAIVRNDNIDELFREICRVAVDYGQFRIAWIGKVDIMTRRVIPVTSAGIVGTALENLFISTEEIPEGMGPTGVAVREKRCVVCNDVLSDERMKPWREEAISNNYRSLAVIPLVTDGRVAYVLNVKVSTPNFFDKDEIRLLEEIGSDISFALETMGKEARRKQSEKDLHISEERYRGLFEHMTEGYAFCQMIYENGEAKDWIYLKVNNAFETLTGLKNVAGRRVSEVIPGIREADPKLFAIYSNAALNGKQDKFEMYVVALKMWFSISVYSPERGYFVAVFDVINERKRSEETLRAREEQYRSVVGNVREIIFQTNAEGQWTFLNPAWTEIMGFTVEESLGQSFANYIHPDDRQHNLELFRSLVDSGKERGRHKVRYCTMDGSIRWIEVHAIRTLANDGTVQGVSGTLTDITGQIKSQQEVSELRTAVETSGEIIFSTNREGVFTYVNPAFTKKYGYTAAEVVGKTTPRILKSGKQTDADYERFWRTLISKNIVKGEMINKTKDGNSIIVEVSVSPIVDKEGTVTGFLAIQRDISEKKQLEEQYYRAQRLESLGTLAGGIAHDLNNVLTPVLLATEILKNRFSDEHSRSIIDTLERSANRGKGIVQQILTFARGSQGERGVLQVKHIIREMEKIIKETFPRSIECRCEIDKNLFPITGDSTQIHQVLLNLCVNARDSMPNGGKITLKAENILVDEAFVKTHIEAKQGLYTVITVSDTGCGMPAELVQKIFEPFFTTKERGKGTGLGLATSHSIIKSHEGFISVDSELGKGSIFYVYIPAIENTTRSLNELRNEQIPLGHGEHILVVDDEASVRDIVKQTLEMFGYKVSQAMDGTEAIAIYAKSRNSVDVVITDIMMPIMDGYATIRALKKINPDVKIIASSGLTADYEIIEATAGKIDAFLQKPFPPTALLETLSELLAKREPHQKIKA